MDILINGNDGHLNPMTFGTITQLEDGSRRTTGNQDRLRQVEKLPMIFRDADGEIQRIEPTDPNWFYALPLGLNGILMWAVPSDWTAWTTIAAEKFGFGG